MPRTSAHNRGSRQTTVYRHSNSDLSAGKTRGSIGATAHNPSGGQTPTTASETAQKSLKIRFESTLDILMRQPLFGCRSHLRREPLFGGEPLAKLTFINVFDLKLKALQNKISRPCFTVGKFCYLIKRSYFYE